MIKIARTVLRALIAARFDLAKAKGQHEKRANNEHKK